MQRDMENLFCLENIYPKNPVEIGYPEYFKDIYPNLAGSSHGIPQMSGCSKIALEKGYDAIIVEKIQMIFGILF